MAQTMTTEREDTMTVAAAIELYRFEMQRLSSQTQRYYNRVLDEFCLWTMREGLSLGDIKPVAVRRYQNYLMERERCGSIRGGKLSPGSIHAHTRAIKTFLAWCSREEGVEEYVTGRTAKRIQLPTLEKKVVEVYTDDEIGRLFGACEREITPELRHRDVAFLSLLLDCGLRAGEIVGLTLDCVHVVSNGGSWVEVTGKGMKSREVGLGVKASQRLFKYIRVYRKADRNERHVFVGHTNTTSTKIVNSVLQSNGKGERCVSVG